MQRVEQADMDVRVRGQSGDELVVTVAGGVIQEYAHAHAAVSCLDQLFDQQAGAQAVLDDVVLQVEAGLGVADQLGASPKGLATVGQQAKPRLPRMGLSLGQHRAPEARGLGAQHLAVGGGAWGAAATRQNECQTCQQGRQPWGFQAL